MTTTGTIELAGLDGAPVSLASEQLEELDSRVQGRLLRPGDQGWNDAVAIWNGMVARLPALVLQPASAHDVAAAVGFARDHGLLLSIKGGGHNIAGTAIAEGGLVLDMSGLREVAVDPDAKLAHVGSGCLLGEVDQATQAHGLATVLGFVSETGVAGLTLGGGFGYLARRFGWTVDNLAEVEVVPTITGGLIVWSAERAEEVLAAYRDLTDSAPRELTAAAIVRLAPPARSCPRSGTASPSPGSRCATAARTPRPTLPQFARSGTRSWTWSPPSRMPPCSRC